MKLIWSSSNLQIDVTMTTRRCSDAKLLVITNLKFVKCCVNWLIGPTLGKLESDEDVPSKNGWLLFFIFYMNLRRTGTASGTEQRCVQQLYFRPSFVVTLIFYSRFF